MDHTDPITVGGLTLVGATAAKGHPDAAKLERAFLDQHVLYPENETAVVHWRWTKILEYVPAMRGRHLYEDLSDVYAAVEAGPPTLAVNWAWDLTFLQERFWDELLARRMCFTHANYYFGCAAQAWRRRLMSRIQNQRAWRRDRRGTLRGPVVKPVQAVQKWMN